MSYSGMDWIILGNTRDQDIQSTATKGVWFHAMRVCGNRERKTANGKAVQKL